MKSATITNLKPLLIIIILLSQSMLIIGECLLSESKYSRKTKTKKSQANLKRLNRSIKSTAKAVGDYIFDGNHVTEFTPEFGKIMMKFASFSYCYQKDIDANDCCKYTILENNNWDVKTLDSSLKMNNFPLTYGFFFSKTYKKIIVSFVGTKKLGQLKEEFHGRKLTATETPGQLKNTYFKNCVDILKQPITDKINDIFKSNKDIDAKSIQIIFTGHSMGGALATLLLFEIVEFAKNNKYDKNNFITSHNIPLLITFGAPRVSNDLLAQKISITIPKIFRVVRQSDPVTKVPFCTTQNKKCLSVHLNGDVFESYSNLNDASEYDLTTNPNYWHVKGKYMLKNAEGSDFVKCDTQDNRGENFTGECNDEFKWLAKKNHGEYFTNNLSKYCRQRLDTKGPEPNVPEEKDSNDDDYTNEIEEAFPQMPNVSNPINKNPLIK